MPVAVSYPGVYVQEVPSGVRTIAGVSTSIGMFIGRTKTGKMKAPVQCLSYEDFVRAFGEAVAGSDMPRAVKLFFANGGSQCWAMRIADASAAPAKVTLRNDTNTGDALLLQAKAEGLYGNAIRLAVSYNTALPEATFNLEVFRWAKGSGGALQKAGLESHVALSMDPKHPRYAPDVLERSSALISATDPNAAAVPGGPGFSQSGFAVSSRTQTIARNQWIALIGAGVAGLANRLRISVDGSPMVDVDFSSLDFNAAQSAANPNALDTDARVATNLPGRIAAIINAALPAGSSVVVTMPAGPTGPAAQDNATTQLLRIESANGDVLIEPSSSRDCAVRLMLGSAQGGLEVSRYAGRRPAPTGFVMGLADIVPFGSLPQNGVGSFDTLTIDATKVALTVAAGHSLFTLSGGPVNGPRMYQDASATGQNDGRNGLSEKLAIMAAAINDQRLADSSFTYAAEVWGQRLAILPLAGGDGAVPVVTRQLGGGAATPLSTAAANVRYYMLGNLPGPFTYQTTGVDGNDGGAPAAADYEAAYKKIDQEVDLFNLMVLPRDFGHTLAASKKLWGPASVFCQSRRAFLLMDPPDEWTGSQAATSPAVGVNTLRVGLVKDHAAVFYPRLVIDDGGKDTKVGAAGAIAGLMARIDGSRGVWKAPAGTEADLRGVIGLEYRFSDGENGVLNQRAVNTLRVFPNGIVNWGARTMDGDDGFGSEYKYIPIRRLALYIEESLFRGLKWVVFEPNDEPLWAQIRLNVGAFMNNLFRQGAFQGQSPKEAYFVRCDASTTTQNDRDLGVVNIVVGFAPLKPAEFVVLTLQQMAGQIQT